MKLWCLVCCSLVQLSVLGSHYRGLSVVNDKLAWMSGTGGTVLRTSNGGETWDTLNPKGYQNKDFRDIHAWNFRHAVVMSAGDSSVLLETTDGGKSWKLIFFDNTPGSFFDAIDVQNKKILLVGDAVGINNPYVVLIDKKRLTHKFNPVFYANQADLWYWGNLKQGLRDTLTFFAASGTNVQWTSKDQFCMIPVTPDTSYFIRGKIQKTNPLKNFESLNRSEMYLVITEFTTLPFVAQKAGGAYAFHMDKSGMGIAVGGSYLRANTKDSTACFSTPFGGTWKPSQSMPGGYRSGICQNEKTHQWFCTGTNGTDVSNDQGENWQPMIAVGFNVCMASKHYLWLAGNKNAWKRIKLKG